MISVHSVAATIIFLVLCIYTPTVAHAAELAEKPCAPCVVDTKSAAGAKGENRGFSSFQAASSRGKELWNDQSLGASGFTCLSGGCHSDFANLHFDANQLFPHYVEMAEKVMTLTQMINYCLENPMAGKALPADGPEMTAMAAFFRSYRMQYKKSK